MSDRLASMRERLAKYQAWNDGVARFTCEDMAWLLAQFPAPTESSAIAAPDGPATPGTDDPGRPITPEDTLKCTEGGPEGATAPGAGEAVEALRRLYFKHRCDEEQACSVCDDADAVLFGGPPATGSREARP